MTKKQLAPKIREEFKEICYWGRVIVEKTGNPVCITCKDSDIADPNDAEG